MDSKGDQENQRTIVHKEKGLVLLLYFVVTYPEEEFGELSADFVG